MKITTFKSQFIPAQNPNSNKLLIALHGLGDSLNGYFWLPEELNLPDLNYLLINAPDTYYDGFSWYDINAKDQEKDILRSRQLLFNLIAELKKQNWHSENIILFGFSQGCVMSLDLALNYEGLFAGICGICGYLFPLKTISKYAPKQQILLTFGDQDELVKLKSTIDSINALNSLGVFPITKQFSKGHSIDFIDEFIYIQKWLKERLS